MKVTFGSFGLGGSSILIQVVVSLAFSWKCLQDCPWWSLVLCRRLVQNKNPEKGGKALDVRSGTGLAYCTATFKPL